MHVKNYTSTVPAEVSIERIEQLLSLHGTTGTLKDYREKRLVGLCFKMTMPDGSGMVFRLPTNHEAVYKTLAKARKRLTPTVQAALTQQAIRTSWRLMQDWVEVQLSLVNMQQAEFAEVFLPYIWDGRQTYFVALKAGDFKGLKMLPAPKE